MLRQILYQFLPYRSFFYPFLVLSAVVAPCWILLRLYRHRVQPHPLSWPRELLLFAGVMYLAGIVTATLLPNRSSRLQAEGRGGVELTPSFQSLTCYPENFRSGSSARSFCLHNARGNVMLFFPFGILLPLIWPRLRFWHSLAIVIAFSCGIELTQYVSSAWGSYRAADINDVILNAFGALVGLVPVYLLRMMGASLTHR